MRQNVGPPSGRHIGTIFRRPTTMFPDHENPSNIAAAAATAPSGTDVSTPEAIAPPVTEQAAQQAESTDGVHATRAPALAREARDASRETTQTPAATEAHSEAPAVD